MWSSNSTALFLLSASEQWALHEYFRLGEKRGDADLLAHRSAVSASDVCSPQRAGRTVTKRRAERELLKRHLMLTRSGASSIVVQGSSESRRRRLGTL